MHYIIYGLYRPGRPIFYVGVTKNLKRRLKEHRQWLGRGVEATVLETGDGDRGAAEHRWIQHYRDAGYKLANKTEGGDGAETLSAELRAAISKRFKGRVVSDETKAKISAANKGRRKNWSAEGAQRVAATHIKPGTKPWNAFTPDMAEAEKEAIRERIRAGQNKGALTKISQASTQQNLKTWSSYTPEQRTERGRRISEGHARRSPEERRALARAGGLALAAARPGATGDNVRHWWAKLTAKERAAEILKRKIGRAKNKLLRAQEKVRAESPSPEAESREIRRSE